MSSDQNDVDAAPEQGPVPTEETSSDCSAVQGVYERWSQDPSGEPMDIAVGPPILRDIAQVVVSRVLSYGLYPVPIINPYCFVLLMGKDLNIPADSHITFNTGLHFELPENMMGHVMQHPHTRGLS